MQYSKSTYNKAISCIVILIIFIILTFIIKNYFKPFFIIIFITFICKPIYDLFCRIEIFNKNVNAVLSILLVNLMIFFITFYTGKIVYNKIYALILENYSQIANNLNEIIHNLNDFFGYDFFKINTEIKGIYSIIPDNSYIRKGAIYTTEGLFAYFISNIAVYFILVDKSTLINDVSKLFPGNNFYIIRKKLSEINKILKIELILVLLTTLQTLVGFIILNIPNAIFLSILCGILDIIPYIGTVLIFIPLILYNFIIKNTIAAIGLTILYILLQVTRQVLETKLVSKKLDVHPLIIILTMYIGIKTFGFIGLFMAPIYVITTKEIVFSSNRKSWRNRSGLNEKY
ncbi:AI-2E family transporter [Clostridium sp. MB40-C1]|uniref:AI-2E family transporter n=1 Tax=Clostridium sp. MB40-C1 TaxID=3070996 RepID=UPI0027DF4794|nr:AI-2E family transporter [Clostridium sp. MB40-C1]WMJ82031.1 AI-2E family transporter [Clostridium sp. MB40-C1]